MKLKSIMPSFYLNNYYSFVFFSSILFIALSIQVPQNIDETILLIRTYIEIPMMYILAMLAVLNLCMYLISFFNKTYRTVTISFFPIYFMISLKALCYIFIFSHTNTEAQLTKGWIEIATCAYIAQVSFFVFIVGLFILLSIKGFFAHLSVPIDKYHWINEHLDITQLNKSKRFEENGKIVSVYFKGFLLDERKNMIVIGKNKLKLSAFKEYINTNNCKIRELSKNGISIIEMLGV